MTVLLGLSAAGVVASLLYYVAATLTALRFARQAASPPPPLPKVAPRVAILKPLHGLGRALVENLATYLEAGYPRIEYIFGVSSYEDSGAEAPLALKPRYQFAAIRLVVGEEPGCSNHKVAKLIRMAERAPRAEIFVLSDADVAVDRGHIGRVVGELLAQPNTGVVTCAYRGRPIGTFASRLEALFVNTDFAPMVMLSEAIEPMRHALGATIAVKRSALEAIGGFRVLKDLLADDFYLGRKAAEHGIGIRLSRSIVTVNCEEDRFGQFWNHQLRWARTYRTVRPISLATILIHGPFWALILLIASGASALAIGALGLVLAARVAMSAVMLDRVLGLGGLLTDIWLVPLKDLLMTAIWFVSLMSSEVTWGGRRFRILRDGMMREVGAQAARPQ